MSITAWVATFILERLVSQNTNKLLEKTKLDRGLIRLAEWLSPETRQRYLQSAFVLGAVGDAPPMYRACFAKSGRDGTFYLEYRMVAGGLGRSADWTSPRKIELARKDRFASGMTVDFPLIGRFDHDQHGQYWFFGTQADMGGEYPRDLLNEDWYYQGRITFQADDGIEQHCYFIVSTGKRPSMPVVTGEHMFSHVWEWEGRAAPNTMPAK